MGHLQTDQHSFKPYRAAFLKNWLRDPIGVASIAPSGRQLARVIAAAITPGSRVVELGVGTGTVTQALLRRGVDPGQLHLVEQNPDFVAILEARYPDAEVLPIDATEVSERLAALAGEVDFVVSGLPILWFEREAKIRILEGAFTLLRPGGSFHQFTYLGRPPVGQRILRELGLKAALRGFAPFNFPPAFAYRFERA